VNSGTDAANRWAVPGDLAHSVAAKRLQGAGFARMPPLATNELDLAAIQLLSDWITLDLPQRQSFTQWQTANFGSPANPDAAPNADPERDGQTNAFEFLAGTSPMSRKADGRWICRPQAVIFNCHLRSLQTVQCSSRQASILRTGRSGTCPATSRSSTQPSRCARSLAQCSAHSSFSARGSLSSEK
jgi:hypothetical protein